MHLIIQQQNFSTKFKEIVEEKSNGEIEIKSVPGKPAWGLYTGL